MGKISAQPQFLQAPQTAAAARPPGRSTPHLAQCVRRLGHVHQTERAQHGVERAVGVLERLGVHPAEVTGEPACRGRRGNRRHHVFRDVRGRYESARTDGVGGAERDEAGAARDVEHPLAGLERGKRQHQILRGPELLGPVGLVGGRGFVPAVSLDAPLELRFHVSFRGG